MPQNPIVPRPGGSLSSLNVTTKSVIKPVGGTVFRVVILQAATAGNVAVFDAATTAGATSGTAIYEVSANWPAAGTVLTLEFPCRNGIVVDPGTGGAVSVSFS